MGSAQPATSGYRLSIPVPGTLHDLRTTYERFAVRATGQGVDTHTRPSVLRMQAYRRAHELVRPVGRFVLLKPDSDEVNPVPWQDSMKVAGWLRHAAAERLSEEYEATFIEQYVQGHTQPEGKSQRVSYVPLPSIHGRYGDGSIRRAIVVEPPDSTGDVIRMLELKLAGCILSSNSGKPACCLGPAKRDDWIFDQYLPQCEMKVWRSATPVVLHGHNADRRGTISITKTESLLLRAFAMAGYGEENIEGFTFQGAPWWPGTKHAFAMRVPNHLTGYPRLHVEVRFKRGVQGPVLAGIGRHYGIGLFATAGER